MSKTNISHTPLPSRHETPLYFKNISLPKISCAGELFDAGISKAQKQYLFNNIKLQKCTLEFLYRLAIKEGPTVALQKVISAFLLGIPADNIPNFLHENQWMGENLWSRFSDNASFSGEHRFNILSANHDEQDVNSPIKWIGANYLSAQARFQYHPVHNSLSAEANTFGMYLDAYDMRYFNQIVAKTHSPHAIGAFAFLRYYITPIGFVVVDIQSDYYGKLPAEFKAALKDWTQNLLIHFERAVIDYFTFKNPQSRPFHSKAIIYLPTPETMKKRWPAYDAIQEDGTVYHQNEIAHALANHVYSKVPASMGYQRIPWPSDFAFPESDPLGRLVHPCDTWCKRILSPQEEQSFLKNSYDAETNYADYLKDIATSEIPESRKNDVLLARTYKKSAQVLQCFISDLYEWYHEYLEKQEFCEIKALGHYLAASPIPPKRHSTCAPSQLYKDAQVETTPISPMRLDKINAVRENWIKINQSFLQHPELYPLLQHNNSYFVYLSKGHHAAINENWWEIKTGPASTQAVDLFHFKDQGRHPQLRYIQFDEKGMAQPLYSLGQKGAGGYEACLDMTSLTADQAILLKRRYQFPMHGWPEAKVRLETHRFWGGLPLTEGENEMLNMLALGELTKELFPKEKFLVPTVLDLGIFRALPLWHKNTTKWLSSEDYMRLLNMDFLSTGQPHKLFPACLRSISACDVRISQLVNRLFEHDSDCSAEDVKYKVDSALAYLYWINRQSFITPRFSIADHEGSIGPAQIAQYLASVFRLNKSAAQHIYKRFASRTLKLIAAVHGAKGHLGGSSINGVGAISGGACAQRNIDLCGGFHDLDKDVFLPWIFHEERDSASEGESLRRLTAMHWYDTLLWHDSCYWMKMALFGASNLAADAKLEEYEIGDKTRVYRIGEYKDKPQPPVLTDPKKLVFAFPTCLRISSQQERNIYYATFERAHKWVQKKYLNDFRGELRLLPIKVQSELKELLIKEAENLSKIDVTICEQ